MPREYALIATSEITAEKALKFKVVTDFITEYIFESVILKDASGQEFEHVTDSVTMRWLESEDEGFTPEQNTIIENARNKVNQGRGNKKKLPAQIRGNSEFASSFNRGNKLNPRITPEQP